jgi:hypothetical protein
MTKSFFIKICDTVFARSISQQHVNFLVIRMCPSSSLSWSQTLPKYRRHQRTCSDVAKFQHTEQLDITTNVRELQKKHMRAADWQPLLYSIWSDILRGWLYVIYEENQKVANSVTPEPEGSSPHSQQSANGPYPEPGESTPQPQQRIYLRSILSPPSHLRLGLQVVFFLRAFTSKPCTRFSHLPCVPHALPTSFSLILSA